MIKEYVALSDVESYNTWIEFQKRNEQVVIGIVKAKKEQGSHDIEFKLKQAEPGEWDGQVSSFYQFKKEVTAKGKAYIGDIVAINARNIQIEKIEKVFEEII